MYLGGVIRKDWPYLLMGVLFIFLLNGLYLPSATHSGLLPDLSIPFTYDGDGLFHLWMVQRVTEGWIYEGARSGYPFGSTFLDFPGSDFGSHLTLKILGLLSGEAQIAFNLFYVIGFAVNYIFSYVVMRCLGLSIPLSFAGSIIFDFLPFHFLRLGHLFYTWYFTVPIFFYIGFILIKENNKAYTWKNYFWLILSLVLLASFGIYNALFGIIVIMTVGLAFSIKILKFKPLAKSAICSSIIILGILLNVSPNLYYRYQAGKNVEIAQRSVAESEVYGFKFVQLLLPRPGHRQDYLSNLTSKYNQNSPLVNENSTSSLGFLGAVGIVIAFIIIALKLSGAKVKNNQSIISLVILVLFMFGTVGGFGVIFAQLITPSIRGWNRVSIFIGFGAIVSLMLVIQDCIYRRVKLAAMSKTLWAVSIIILSVGIYDQTSPVDTFMNEDSKKTFEYDRQFVKKIEGVLPEGAAVYQMPYIGFPEVAPINSMGPYNPLTAYIHSKNLKWSSGGTKGRFGDLFYRNLSQETFKKQFEIIKELGFSGVYFDMRGYGSNGQVVLDELATVLGSDPLIKREDGKIVFFKINNEVKFDYKKKSDSEIVETSGYVLDKFGRRYNASLSEGIDFSKPGFPVFIKTISGLSAGESWGRWSDANEDSAVSFEFNNNLPRSFLLELDLIAYGPNSGRNLRIDIGTDTYYKKLPDSDGVITLQVNSKKDVNLITLTPPEPISPKELNQGADSRKLALGFRKMSILVK
jgi:phosphoglycerol transferase